MRRETPGRPFGKQIVRDLSCSLKQYRSALLSNGSRCHPDWDEAILSKRQLEVSGGSLFVVAAAGILIFRERVGAYGIAGIAMGILSLVMLSAA
jgi:hypothetical protein